MMPRACLIFAGFLTAQSALDAATPGSELDTAELKSWAGPWALASPTGPVLLESAFGASPDLLQAQYQALLGITDARVWYDWHGGTRRVAGQTGWLLPDDLASPEGGAARERVISQLKTILLAKGTETLEFQDRRSLSNGETQVVLTESVGGIPVRDSWISLTADRDTRVIREISARFLPDRGLDREPTTSADDATARVLEWVHQQDGLRMVRSDDGIPSVPGVELRRPAYLSYRIGDVRHSRGTPIPRLIWVVELDLHGRAYRELEVDALNGMLSGFVDHERGWYTYPPPLSEVPRANLDPSLVARWMSYSTLQEMRLVVESPDASVMSTQPRELRLPPPAYRTRPVSLVGTVLEPRISADVLARQFQVLQAMPNVWIEYSPFGAPTSISGDTDLVLSESVMRLKVREFAPELLALLRPVILARGTETLQILDNRIVDPVPGRADRRHLIHRRTDVAQSIRGIRVMVAPRSEARLAIEADFVTGEITRINGQFLPDWGLPAEPRISAQEAIERRFSREVGVVPFESTAGQGIVAPICPEHRDIEVSESPPTLAYVFGPPGPGWALGEFGRLVWCISYFDGCHFMETWVDAVDGTVVGAGSPTSVN